MVPNFALFLSFEGISLLRRVKSGWARIEDVSLGDADLDAAMARLKERALDLDGRGDKVLLVIPNEQIRYLDLPDFGGDASSRDAAARAGLDGATPYAVEELSYDHSHAGGRMFVAAVARETLGEAEGFATTHGFVPMGFVGIAPEGSFEGAVWFGPASDLGRRKVQKPHKAMTIVKADKAALRPVDPPKARAPKPIPAAARIKAEEPLDVPEPPVEPGKVVGNETAPAAAEPVIPVPPEPVTPVPPEPSSSPEPDQPPQPDQTPEPVSAAHAALQANAAQAAAKEEPPAEDTPPVAFASRRSGAEPKPRLTASRAEAPGSAPIKPRFTPIAPPPRSSTPDVPPMTATAGAPDRAAPEPKVPELKAPAPKAPAEASAPPPPEEASEPPAKESFAARLIARRGLRQSSKEPAAPPPVAVPAAPNLSRPEPEQPEPEVAPVDAADTPDQPPVEAPFVLSEAAPQPATEPPEAPSDAPVEPTGNKARGRFAALRPRPKPKPAPAAPSVTSDEERQRLTVFGQRHSEKVGGKPRFLGLFLTLGLLLFLVGVAAWATVFLDNGVAQLFRSQPEQPTAVALVQDPATQQPAALTQPAPASAPAPSVAPLAETAPDPAPLTAAIADADTGAEAVSAVTGDDAQSEAQEDVVLAALEGPPEPLPELPALSRPIIPRALSREEAAATYAATGIWQRSPLAPRFPPADGVEQVYVASIDPSVQQFDAVAIPKASRIAPEAGIADPGLPPPADLRFDFDQRGVVRATPEGALTPDGLRVFTGRPPVVPPLAREASLAPAQTGVATDISPRPEILNPLASFRPSARPSDLLEQKERAELGGISRSELAAIRPLLRPRTAQEEAQSEEPDTPATAQAVARSLLPVARPRNMAAIVRRAERQQPQEVRTAAVAPRTVNPSGPTATSVSRAATERNAINLSKVSLIGVYGTASKRRALVRLPNGKYENVKSGDRLDGGRVTAIGESDLRYTKGGRSVTLKMPRS